MSTVAGTGIAGYSGDGSAATSAQLNTPSCVTVDDSGNVYIADTNNYRVRRVSTSGIITTVAGIGSYSSSGDGGAATKAALAGPTGLAMDASGNLYIADAAASRIRKVSPVGTISTFAGTTAGFGYSGDGGPAVNAQLASPWAVAVDVAGSVYVADAGNHRIRRISADGTITTVAGTGAEGFSGDGGPARGAQLDWPRGVALDAAGNLYITDTYNYRVRKVATTGIIATLAGTGYAGYSGDGGPPANAQLNQPQGVAVDATGRIYVADTSNNAVRVLLPAGNQPVFTVQATHSGDFAFGQSGASYTVTVTNAIFAGASSGPVTLTAQIASGLTLVGASGNGWTCTGNTCSRGDALAGGASYPPVTVFVNVAPNAPPQVTSRFSASGGGGFVAGASDLSNIVTAPAITSVVNGASYLPGIADGSWISIFGTNLAATTRGWRDDEIVNGKLPTSLDGVGVAIDGLPAAMWFISPSQLNVQVPRTGKTGPINVVVTRNSVASSPVPADVRRNAPGLFVNVPGGGKYPAAVIARSDGGADYLGPVGLFGKAPSTRPARPGEIIELFGTGLGPTNPTVEPGLVFSGAAPAVDQVSATIGGTDAPVLFVGAVGAGLYQMNVTVPNLPPGDQALVVKVNGAPSQPGVFVAVGQ